MKKKSSEDGKQEDQFISLYNTEIKTVNVSGVTVPISVYIIQPRAKRDQGILFQAKGMAYYRRSAPRDGLEN
jgi:hypothetical protein